MDGLPDKIEFEWNNAEYGHKPNPDVDVMTICQADNMYKYPVLQYWSRNHSTWSVDNAVVAWSYADFNLNM